MKKLIIHFGIAVLLLAGLLVLLNAPYFIKQIIYQFSSHPKTELSQEVQQVDVSKPEMGEANRLTIPSLNINAPIRYVDEVNEEVFQRALQDGVVHYPGTAAIGQPGNVYLFGHSSDFVFAPGNYKTVFALLPRIQNEAEIVVTDTNGQVYRYAVTGQFVVNNDETQVLDQKGNVEKLLTLQTSYPIGTALQRYIVTAKLVK